MYTHSRISEVELYNKCTPGVQTYYPGYMWPHIILHVYYIICNTYMYTCIYIYIIYDSCAGDEYMRIVAAFSQQLHWSFLFDTIQILEPLTGQLGCCLFRIT